MNVAYIRGWLAVFCAYGLLWVGSAAFNTVQFVRALSSVDRLEAQIGTLFVAVLLYVAFVFAFGFGLRLILCRSATPGGTGSLF